MWMTIVLALLGTTQAYKSRPDLTPPKLNITTSSQSLSPGYLFISPYGQTPDLPAQPGNYILRSDGELIYSGVSHWGGWNGNFQAAKYKGQDVLFSYEGSFIVPQGHGFGHHKLLDSSYRTVAEVRADGYFKADFHEFIITDDSKAVFGIWQPVQKDLRSYGGEEESWVAEAVIQEIDIESGKVLFEWHSLDHVPLDESLFSLSGGVAGNGSSTDNAWDYFHLNSIQKGLDGHYIISARSTSTIYKVNGTSGDIIWRLGSQSRDFKLDPGVEFGFQHHARYLPGSNDSTTLISLFDNSWSGSGPRDGIYLYSHGKYIALDHVKKHAKLIREFIPPNNNIAAKSQGSLHTLKNGNVLINWGSEGQITEYAPNGTVLYHAHVESNIEYPGQVQNYRAFKYEWTGVSLEKPALVVEPLGHAVIAYLSWNGDTRVIEWRLHFSQSDDRMAGSSVIQRGGFETEILIPTQEGFNGNFSVIAEGLDASGDVLGQSETVVVEIKVPQERDSHAQRPLI